MTLRFNKTMLQDGANRMRAWLKKEQYYPNWLIIKDTQGKEHKLKPLTITI